MGDLPVLSFSQYAGPNSEQTPPPLVVLESPSTRFHANQLRHHIQQVQRQIDKIAKEVERTSESDDTKQLARMLVKLTALMGLSLAQDAGDRRMLVKSLLQENE
jgi:L-lactate utilization protein LutC